MKEYRIKARSAEHRRAIIGALEGMGFVWPHCTKDDKGNMEYPFVVVYPDEERADGRSEATPTHTSLDSLLEDIERDRRTVDVKYDGDTVAVVAPDHVDIKIRDGVLRLEYHTRFNFDSGLVYQNGHRRFQIQGLTGIVVPYIDGLVVLPEEL